MAEQERPRRTSIESEDEVLGGAEPLAGRVAAMFRGSGGSSRRATNRLRLIGALSAVAALLAAAIFAVTRPQSPGSHFTVNVVTAAYAIPRTGGIDSTLTISNPTPEPVTLTVVTLGRARGQDVGLGSAYLALGLAPNERQTVTVHGDFDCRPNHPALPNFALFTGADRAGRVRTVEAALPDSIAYSAAHAAYRDQVCKLPYPLALAEFSYVSLTPTGPRTFTVALDATLSTALDLASGTAPVTLTAVSANTPGVSVLMDQGGAPLTLSPGTTTHVATSWTVTDCAAIPPYYGLPTVIATAVNARATETRYYGFGARFGNDLAAALAAACPEAGQ